MKTFDISGCVASVPTVPASAGKPAEHDPYTRLFVQCEEIQAKYLALRTKYQELRTLCEELIHIADDHSPLWDGLVGRYEAIFGEVKWYEPKENQP